MIIKRQPEELDGKPLISEKQPGEPDTYMGRVSSSSGVRNRRNARNRPLHGQLMTRISLTMRGSNVFSMAYKGPRDTLKIRTGTGKKTQRLDTRICGK